MRLFILFAFVMLSISSYSKEPDPRAVLAEGKLLYHLEKASWFATDDYLVRFAHKIEQGGGYVSYQTHEGFINTVFFDKNDPDKLQVRYTFDISPKPIPLIIDSVDMDVTMIEKDLIALRQDASKIASYACTIYKNTSMNFIPVISEKERKVYILTASENKGILLLGNDYLFRYGVNNKFKDMKRIHNSLIEIPYDVEGKSKEISAGVHSHVFSDIIDPTDICTLLLYRDYVKWRQHYVISKKYVSIFDMEKEDLVVMTRKAWDNISKQSKDKIGE